MCVRLGFDWFSATSDTYQFWLNLEYNIGRIYIKISNQQSMDSKILQTKFHLSFYWLKRNTRFVFDVKLLLTIPIFGGPKQIRFSGFCTSKIPLKRENLKNLKAGLNGECLDAFGNYPSNIELPYVGLWGMVGWNLTWLHDIYKMHNFCRWFPFVNAEWEDIYSIS